jgi:hypothetical protein
MKGDTRCVDGRLMRHDPQPDDYWADCLSEAALECGAILTAEQLSNMASAVRISHENYGMAFYSPPPSDRLHAIKREEAAKLTQLQAEFDAYRNNAEAAIKRALRQDSRANVTIGKGGEVTRWGGRTEVIQ